MLPLRIAQIAPLSESVSPRSPSLDGSKTERAVGYLTDELVRLGHEVTLFASSDSRSIAHLVKCSNDGDLSDALAIENVFARANDFDIIHFHTPPKHFPLLRRSRIPAITTLYGKLDSSSLQTYFNEFSDMSIVALSESQRLPLNAKWRATIPIGLPHDLFIPTGRAEGYLAFTAPLCPESRVDRAIEIARLAGLPLKILSVVAPQFQPYFEKISHLLQLPFVEFIRDIGETDDRMRNELLGRADALLWTVDKPEPFAIGLIEAFACGTPVVAFRSGSVPEILTDGLTGFVVETIDGAVARIREISLLSRSQCRKVFEKRFTSARMAKGYVDVFEREIASHRGRPESKNQALSQSRLWS